MHRLPARGVPSRLQNRDRQRAALAYERHRDKPQTDAAFKPFTLRAILLSLAIPLCWTRGTDTWGFEPA
ncbi:MAG: hypothetical protein ACRD4O_05950 [Bryobacteraceae bacterium]